MNEYEEHQQERVFETRKKGYEINTESFIWIHRRIKQVKSDELEAPLESSWESPGKNMKEKNGETSINKMILD